MTPAEYCKNKAAKSGSSFYHSFRFLTPDKRQAVTALYAFCREVDDTVDDISDLVQARAQLDNWREHIDSIFNGAPIHPVAIELKKSLVKFDLNEAYFIEIIDGMEMDLEQNRYPEFKHLALYCHRVASVVGLLLVEIFGYDDRKTLTYAENLGMALQLTNIIRDVKEDAERGRIYLPQSELDQFNVKESDLLALKSSPELTALLKYQTKRAHDYYQKAMKALPECDRYNQRTGLMMAKIYQETLFEIEKNNFNVMHTRTSLSAFRKLWLAWQTSRQEKQRHKKLS